MLKGSKRRARTSKIKYYDCAVSATALRGASRPRSCIYHTRRSRDKCVGGKPDCPLDATFNGVECISTENPTCPEGFNLKKGRCVLSEDPSCPDGWRFSVEEKSCISESPATCGPGQVLHGSSCVLDDCVNYEFCPAPVTSSQIFH
jgi:hypothetical protein